MTNRIESIGLRVYLNRTRIDHNGKNYEDFKELMERKVGPSATGKIFGVDWRTAKKWIAIYRKEQEGAK